MPLLLLQGIVLGCGKFLAVSQALKGDWLITSSRRSCVEICKLVWVTRDGESGICDLRTITVSYLQVLILALDQVWSFFRQHRRPREAISVHQSEDLTKSFDGSVATGGVYKWKGLQRDQRELMTRAY
ncbi:hypothetical protein J6590_097601, partial [Homalodisca vitripennis]